MPQGRRRSRSGPSRGPSTRAHNGWWEFETDPGDSGLERGVHERDLARRILVPFCPEAPLSGVGTTDRLAAVWYRRTVQIPAGWSGHRVLLHFQAVDYEATVWVNGTRMGSHNGGFTPFGYDLTSIVRPGETATIVVRARDPWWKPQPRGKQSRDVLPERCLYGRTTGIWQTVWLEAAGDPSLLRPRLTPDVGAGMIRLEQGLSRPRAGLVVTAQLSDGQGGLSSCERLLAGEPAVTLDLVVPQERRRLWCPADPHLYTVEIQVHDEDGRLVDGASSYAGLRSVGVSGQRLLLNNEPVFQRLVLDQGFYPDGVLTAPDDASLVRDIQLALAAGFNGARLHQKVFEERFLFHADTLGYLVWGEFADWGCAGFGPDDDHQQPGPTYLAQWLEVLDRDYSHPSIIGWCPLNETYQPISDRVTTLDDVTRGLFLATKAADRTRPVLDASGYSHRVPEADVYDSHDYAQDIEVVRRHHAGLISGRAFVNQWEGRDISIPYGGQPYLVSEFGGAWWSLEDGPGAESWGYGDRPRTVEELFERFRDLCTVLLANPGLAGYCYTQLTDVYQERNGVLDFHRSPKLDLGRLRAVQQQKAAIEAGPRPGAAPGPQG
jgi:beta-galactosidase/beta-glucuronidase